MAAELDATGWAFEFADADWHVRWVSSEFRATIGATEDADVGIGEPLLASRARYAVSPETGLAWARQHVPFMLAAGIPRDELRAMALDESYAEAITAAEAFPAPPLWAFHLDFPRLGRVQCLGVRVTLVGGEVVGALFLYGSGLPTSLLQFVARGDAAMFRRSAQLIEPGRHGAAVLFADLEGSTALSRRLPTARFFDVIRDLMTGMDAATIANGGIVGKHGGDGATGFFLAEQVGSVSAAARAAVGAGRAILACGRALGVEVNVGLHWGESLYLGQVTTGGRLEVTALGDEVNECARVQESGSGGCVLATKALLERLDPADAAALDLDLAALEYRVVAELGGAGPKAVRDAGAVPVAEVGG